MYDYRIPYFKADMDWVAYELRIVIINVFIGIMNKLLHGNIVKTTI